MIPPKFESHNFPKLVPIWAHTRHKTFPKFWSRYQNPQNSPKLALITKFWRKFLKLGAAPIPWHSLLGFHPLGKMGKASPTEVLLFSWFSRAEIIFTLTATWTFVARGLFCLFFSSILNDFASAVRTNKTPENKTNFRHGVLNLDN